MRRREFITLLGGAAAWPLAARAQQPAMPVVGYLSLSSRDASLHLVRSFREGLAQAGFIEGRNVAIEYRWASEQYDQLPALADELVRRGVDVIASTGGVPGAQATKAATATIPIVFVVGGDPVKAGLVTSLNRPGGNLTGVSNLNVELGPKRLEVLHELLPTVTTIAALANPTSPNTGRLLQELQSAAAGFGLKLHVGECP